MEEKKADVELSPEQLARIESNRKKAFERRQQLLKQQALTDLKAEEAEFAKESIPTKKSLAEISSCQSVLDSGEPCGSIPVDQELLDNFDEYVCKSCKFRTLDDYALISRGDCMSKYLIPDDALKVMRCMTKNNPHNPGWTPMKLFLKKHVLKMAFKRFGSLEALEMEKKRRETQKFERALSSTEETLNRKTEEYKEYLAEESTIGDKIDATDIGKRSAVNVSSHETLLQEDNKNNKKKRGNSSNSTKDTKRKKIINDFISIITDKKK
jgi:DNA repair protein